MSQQIGDDFGIKFDRLLQNLIDTGIRRIRADHVRRNVTTKKIPVFRDLTPVVLIVLWEVVEIDPTTPERIKPNGIRFSVLAGNFDVSLCDSCGCVEDIFGGRAMLDGV